MPPKVRVTKEEIINAAFEIVRRSGPQALNARNVATALNCSTQPIFSNFASMEELQEAVGVAAYEMYLQFLNREVESGEYPQYKCFGMGYIRFAKEEKELFKFLFMRNRQDEKLVSPPDFTASIEMIMRSNGITREKAELMHLEMWSCVHGISTMLATSFLDLDRDLVSNMVTDIYQGLRTRHLTEG